MGRLLKLGVIIWLLQSASAANAKELHIASDVWCPYICSSSEQPGFLVEILQQIAKSSEYSLKIEHLALARALQLVKKDQIDIVLALTPAHISQYQLQRSNIAFGGLYNDFYVKADDNWQYTSIEALEQALEQQKVFGVIKGYFYGEVIDAFIAKHQDKIHQVHGLNPLETGLQMLANGRIDIFLDSRATVEYTLTQLAMSNVRYAGSEGKMTPLYLGYANHSTNELVDMMDQGLVKLRNNGKLKEILDRYHVKDWHKAH